MTAEPGPISVAHVLAPAPYGGLETVVVTLSRAQAELGARVTVVLVVTPEDHDETGHPVARALGDANVDVETWVLPVRAYREERRRVAGLLRRKSVDVLHTHGYRPDVADAGVARKHGVVTVSTMHGRIGGSWKGRIYEWVQVRALRRFDAVIAVSEKLSGELGRDGIAEERLHLIRNAWAPRRRPLERESARRELGLPEQGPVIGWLGRMGQEKAPDVFLRAAAKVGDPTVVFSVVGDGPLRGACEALAEEAGMEDRVRFHGAVPDAGSLLKAYDAFVLSSWTEGTPMALLEAMHARVPVIATRVGGVPDVVGDSEAILCEAGDAAGIADAIDRIFAEPEAALDRAGAAKERLDRDFAVEPWARRHLELYRSLIP